VNLVGPTYAAQKRDVEGVDSGALAELAKTTPQFANWRYYRFEVHPDDLPVALERLLAASFQGVNLTVPHKIIAFDRVHLVDPIAQPIGAVNTLVKTSAGGPALA
jgi:shikimate dehydrogenase